MPNYKHKSSKSDGKQTRIPFFLEKLNEKTRENFLIDIQNLESKLEKYTEKYEDSIRKRNNLTERIDRLQHNEQNSINKFSQELEDKTKELNDLKEEIVMMVERNELERDVNESRLNEKKHDLEVIKNKLMNENERLSKELHSLEEFKLDKSELTKKVKTLESEIEQGKSEYQAYVLQMQAQRKRNLAKIKDMELNEKKLCKKVVASKKIIKLMEEKLGRNDETMRANGHAENNVFQLEVEIDSLKKALTKAKCVNLYNKCYKEINKYK
ncbi:hypothetical protein HELRODRAFT_195146 [Helobdella robusta]|uniref:Cilia- and flagella-associated protein 157 n=1 Tax=Helobdella robusta TaxID=6412 RepID=T1FWT1_HELRO|nr:hypothetical protein HELRODRAFT_195146 [Helobdella robusta]ESO09172.1 hypothetical protein HELRODRAFT_195146 [Helobdella robusta]